VGAHVERGDSHNFLLTEPASNRPAKKLKRKQVIILLAIAVVLLFAVLVSQTAFSPTILQAETNQQAVVFYALSLLISLLFVALTFVLARNLLKLLAERRMGVLGSKFRTRMVAGALLLSFVPVIVMYWFAYGLMNRSIDKWFSTPVEEVRSDTQAMASLLASYAMQNARAEAAAIATSPAIQQAFADRDFAGVTAEFQRHELTQLGRS
jgi:two-component system, NtrC family, nitrogen regulation sensor histidine kinase NtrY